MLFRTFNKFPLGYDLKRIVKIVVCDVGLKEFITFSDGAVIEDPKHTKKLKLSFKKEKKCL